MVVRRVGFVLLVLSSTFVSSQDFDEDVVDLCASYGAEPRPHRVKVYDGFEFFTELDVLEVRLYELSPVVEKFILVESERTHSNKPKPLIFQQNTARYAKYKDQIQHVVASLPEESPSWHDPSKCGADDHSCHNRPHWVREGSQRIGILRGLEGAQPDDVLLISDVDEIPSRETVEALSLCNFSTPITLRTHFYYYSLRWVWLTDNGPHQWMYPQAINVGDMEKHRVSPNDVRYFNPSPKRELHNSGWHLSYFGGPKAVKRKILALAHQENNKPDYTDLATITAAMEEGRDLFGREAPHGELAPSGVRVEDGVIVGDFPLPRIVTEEPSYVMANLPHLMPPAKFKDEL